VVETYEWRIGEQMREQSEATWRLSRLQIVPQGVPGAKSVDLTFGR